MLWHQIDKTYMSLDVLRSTYFSYAHTIISYGIVFWGNSSYREVIFKIQKRIIRIIMNSSRNASCWQLFKDLNILPLKSQYIYTPSFYLLLKTKTNFCLTHKFINQNKASFWSICTHSKLDNIPKGCLLLRNKDLHSSTNSH